MSMSGLFFDQALLPTGWARDVRVQVAGTVIASVECGAEVRAGEERHAIGLPALGNLHSHAFQRGMAGLAERRGPRHDSFWTWREVMYRFLAAMTPDDVEAVAAQAYVEMLEAGFSRVGEFHYLHHDPAGQPYANIGEMAERIVAAATSTGIGMTLLPVFYAHGGFGAQPPSEGQKRFVSGLDDFARLVDAARAAAGRSTGTAVGIAPHSLRAVTPDELMAILPVARGGPVHIHVAEQIAEVDACLAWSGQRPVEWLFDHAPVDGNWCLIHATQTTSDELAKVARSGAVVGLCPVTEANLGDGTFDGLALAKHCGRFGIGTDSNVLIDAASELRQLEYSQRLALRSRNVLASADTASNGRTLFDAALAGGNQALGAYAKGLHAGGSADIVSLDVDHPSLVGRAGDDLLDSWIFSGTPGCVDAVWAGGAQIVCNGRHNKRDAIAARFRTTMRKLLAS